MSASPVIYFDGKDFETRTYNNKKIFCLKVDGLVLVYYYSPQCKYCINFTPFFQSLATRLVSTVKFGIVNCKNIMDTINQSLDSTTPISEVPYIMLYSNGWPVERYMGPADIESIKNFIILVREKINSYAAQQAQNAQNSQGAQQAQGSNDLTEERAAGASAQMASRLPPTVTSPYKACHLTYSEAYNANNTLMTKTTQK